MTALAAFRDTRQIAGPITPSALCALNFPVAAATTIFAGAMVGTDAAGNAVPASASTVIKIWGRAEKTVANTGAAGALTIDVMPGVFSYQNGSGADALTAAHVGRIVYASDDNTVNLTDGAGLRPAAGKFYGLDGTQAKVGLGEPSLWDLPDDVVGPTNTVKQVRARNVINGNVAALGAYVVAANTALNDNVLAVAGDIVLLVAQTAPAENGLYLVGTIAGTAPLTRLAPMPLGYVFLKDEFEIAIGEGDVFAHTQWFNSAAGTVGTNTPAFMPESVTITQALVAGTLTLASVPILSATKTGVAITRSTANTCTLTVNGYACNGNPTAGALGTASLPIIACVAAGTINVADISTLHITITNR